MSMLYAYNLPFLSSKIWGHLPEYLPNIKYIFSSVTGLYNVQNPNLQTVISSLDHNLTVAFI